MQAVTQPTAAAPGGDAVGEGRPEVFLDVTVAGHLLDRVKIELFSDICPRAAENFRQLCTGEHIAAGTGRPMGYRNSGLHWVAPDFMIAGGDIVNHDGTGQTCIYNDAPGGLFESEEGGLAIPVDRTGLVLMSNDGPHRNGSQFFIMTTARGEELNGYHVVVGRVTQGIEALRQLQNLKLGKLGRPHLVPLVLECGQM